MDSADAATPLGAWAWIRGYFTPATLFLVVNLVIGTIALTSRATQQRRRREHYYHDDAHGHHLQEEPLHPQIQQPGYGHYYHPEQTLYAPPPAPAPLARTSSVLDRLRSLGLYRFRSGDLGPDLPTAAETDEKEKQEAAHYGRSRSETAREQGKKKQEARMSKSTSSGVVEEAETEQGVDARAADFINKFRQQLQLQRLNSLLNYKEMLNRGGGGKQ